MKRASNSMKKFFFILAFQAINNSYAAKHIIGYQEGAGLFYNYLGVINNILWCQNNNRNSSGILGLHSYLFPKKGYQRKNNVWEYYFEPVSIKNTFQVIKFGLKIVTPQMK